MADFIRENFDFSSCVNLKSLDLRVTELTSAIILFDQLPNPSRIEHLALDFELSGCQLRPLDAISKCSGLKTLGLIIGSLQVMEQDFVTSKLSSILSSIAKLQVDISHIVHFENDHYSTVWRFRGGLSS
jgi:hypothetical protein